MILYTGYDLMAQLVSSPRSINCMYLEYKNGAAPTEPVITAARTKAYYDGLMDPYGYVRAYGLFAPELRTVVAGCEDNELVFAGSTGSGEMYGAQLIDGNSTFYSAALLHAPDPLDASQDILFNAFPLKNNGTFATIKKLIRLQVGVRASVRFGPPGEFPTILLNNATDTVPAFTGSRLYELTVADGQHAHVSTGAGSYSLFPVYNDKGILQVRWGTFTPAERYSFRYTGDKLYLNAPGFAFSMTWMGYGSLRFKLEGYDTP